MFIFLETDIKEQKNYNNAVTDLLYKTKIENCVKDKNNLFLLSEALLFFLKKKFILFLETYIFKIFTQVKSP